MSSITAISVTYNSAGVITDTLRAVLASPHIAEAVVVDNCSNDGCSALIAQQFPNVKLIRNACNEGFGQGNNIALAQVETPYALLVNPDAVVSNTAIEQLLAAASRYPDAAILAPQLVDDGGEIHLSYKRSVFNREKAAGISQLAEGDICADYLSGAVWLLNMAHFKTIGFFDPQIFLFYEDDDLCLRARKAGFSCVLVADATVTHLKGGSSGTPNPASEFFKQQHMIWSRLYLQQKYHGIESARKLARVLYNEYALKTLLYAFALHRRKRARYKGRMAGVKAFNSSPTQAPRL